MLDLEKLRKDIEKTKGAGHEELQIMRRTPDQQKMIARVDGAMKEIPRRIEEARQKNQEEVVVWGLLIGQGTSLSTLTGDAVLIAERCKFLELEPEVRAIHGAGHPPYDVRHDLIIRLSKK